MRYSITIVVLVLVISIGAAPFEDDKNMNPIMRHFAKQSRLTNPVTHAYTSGSRTGEAGYRNCYLSPIQCNLPVLREQNAGSMRLENNDMRRFRRMFVF